MIINPITNPYGVERGRAGVVDGEMGRGGSNSGRCLKWGSGGSLRNLSKNILKLGW